MELQEVIARLKEIKDERGRLDREEELLSTPALTNTRDIPLILSYCEEAYKSLRRNKRRSEVRRMFIFVILFLYSPKTLAGGKMSKGLRTKIADSMGIESSNVSHYHADVWFYYTVYSDFREDVNAIFKLVFEKLRNQ